MATDKLARKIAEAIALAGLTCLLIQAAVIVIDVLLRWLFNSPIFGMEDINQILLAAILASFFPALLIERQNITIDFLGRALGPRVSSWFDVFGHTITLLLFVIVAWQLAVYAIEVRTQTTLILRIPVSPGWWLTTGLMALCVPVQIIVVAVHLRIALNDHDGSQPVREPF